MYVNKNWREIQIKLLNVLLHCQNSIKAKFSISYNILILHLKVILIKKLMSGSQNKKNNRKLICEPINH